MKLEGKQIGALIAIILGLILAFLPVQSRQITINPDELSQSILDSGDRLDPETVSQWIIEGNNEYLLMDVRSPEKYQQGHIKSAVNLPLADLLKMETIANLNTDKLIILYSNGISHASQAWVVLYAAGISNVVILEGGLNYWNNVILNPQAPNLYASNDEILIYKTRAAIATSLGGSGATIQEENPQLIKPKRTILKKRSKKKVDGGC